MSTSTIDTETLENSVQTGVNQLLRGGWGEALKTILFALLLLVICLVTTMITMGCSGRIIQHMMERKSKP